MKASHFNYFLLLAFIVLQSGITVSAQTRIVSKAIGKAIKKEAKEETIEAAAKHAAKSTGNAFKAESFMKQSKKRITREALQKQMKVDGQKSLQALGVKGTKSELERMKGRSTSKSSLSGKSQYKHAVNNPNAKNPKAIIHSSGYQKQYVDMETYKKKALNVQQELGQDHNAGVLRRNLNKFTGTAVSKEGVAAHHVVGSCSKIAKPKLKRYGIDINDAMNGIFLPNNVDSKAKGVGHSGRSGESYCEAVDKRFLGCKSKEDCYIVLDELKKQLYDGELLINDNKIDKAKL